MLISNSKYLELQKRTALEATFLPIEQLRGKSILIAGASGMIGSAVVDLIMFYNKHYGLNVTIYALGRNEEYLKQRFSLYIESSFFIPIISDVTQPFKVKKLDFIIHAASGASPKKFATEPTEVMKANILGTINLVEVAKENKCENFLFISTGEIYGDDGDKTPKMENAYNPIDSMNSRSCYPMSKKATETYVVSAAKEFGIKTTVARLSHSFGPTMMKTDDRAAATFIRMASENKDIIMKSKGEQVRSYIFTSDAATALLMILLVGERSQAYNVTSDIVLSIKEYAAKIISLNKNIKLVQDIPSELEIQGFSKISHGVLSNHKLKSLGWRQLFTADEALLYTLDLVKNN